jgi:hypothetical protein
MHRSSPMGALTIRQHAGEHLLVPGDRTDREQELDILPRSRPRIQEENARDLGPKVDKDQEAAQTRAF